MKQFLISDEVGRFQKETKNYIYFNWEVKRVSLKMINWIRM
jgi:hypothetical protein